MDMAEDKVKNIIIDILSEEWPLTAKKIYNRIKKDHRKNISYQAVFKALGEMKEKGVVKKDEYFYSLDMAWINDAYNKFEDLKRAYEDKPKNILLSFIKEKTFTVEFNSYYKALSTFLQLMDRISFLVKGNKNGHYVESRHLYWPFVGNEREQEKLKEIFGKTDSYVLCNSDTPIDKMIYRYYKKLNPNTEVVFGKSVVKEHETIITGDFIGQIYYPKDFVKALDKIYKENNIDKMGEMFELLFNKKAKIIAVISKNAEFANLGRRMIREAMGN